MTAVLDLDRLRIARALHRRIRYKYVQPRVVREGLGWKVVSPNCSRNVDPQGGEIDIAWLQPGPAGTNGLPAFWLLHARDHVQGCWALKLRAPTLPDALDRLVQDPHREFWQ